MTIGTDIDAIRTVVVDYLEGMIWGQTDRIERAFHPRAIQAGHFAGGYEFMSRQEFVDWLKAEPSEPAGSPYTAELLSVEVTGDVAVVKVNNTCFGTDFTDWLMMIRDGGQWQIVAKAFHAHGNAGAAG